jgi:type IV pilus assembly protein PilW
MSMRAHRQAGLSMIELMIALTLGAVLLAGVVQLFVATKRSYGTNTAVGQLQENARFAMNFISNATRQAGYLGCGNSYNPNFTSMINTATGNFDMDFTQAITGYAFTSGGVIGPGSTYTMPSSITYAGSSGFAADTDPASPAMEVSLTNAVSSTYPYPALAGSDVLVVRETDNNALNLQGPTPLPLAVSATSIQVDTPAGLTLKSGQLGIMTNCITAISFQMTSVSTAPSGSTTVATVGLTNSGTPGNTGLGPGSKGFGTAFGAGSILVLPYTYAFYIGVGADGQPALYEQYFQPSTSQRQYVELVSGVEAMHVLYGVAPTNGIEVPAYYTTADKVPSFSQVVSVEIALVLQSNTGAVPLPSAVTPIYVFGPSGFGGTLTLKPPLDTRLRRVATAVIALRERLP